MLNNVITSPFSRMNDTINLSSKLNALINTEQLKLNSIILDNGANKLDTHHQMLELQKSFLYVCTESVYNYPTVYLSEKSYKGITVKRPFIILGATGSLAKLKEFGFQTFDAWWDESYDLISSDQKRLLAVYAIIKHICSKSVEELNQVLLEMSSILDYNFHHYQTFGQQELRSFNRQCMLNLNRRCLK